MRLQRRDGADRRLEWGGARNPYLSFRILEAESGGKVRIQWVDNLGKEESIETVIS
ncbi:MAG TPA: hypothetical protein EYH03_05910 [Chromatiales bacterium]|nr:hypothetical protein [Chromatiales bacterium]